jgi:PAS domain S-box-containing protein
MFRVKESDISSSHTVASWTVLVTLLLALMANLGSVVLVLQEHQVLGTWLNHPDPPPGSSLEALRQEVGLQIAATLVVSFTLVVSIVALGWLRRRYLLSQQSLRHVKMLAHDILASMDQGVVTSDRQGIITSINSAAGKLLGLDDECVGRTLKCISSAELSLVTLRDQVAETQTSVRDRDFTVNRSERVQRICADAHLLKDMEGRTLGAVIHLRDVSERVLLEERMRRMERFISLGTLASGLHHEIKNPLTALSIHVQLLEEQLKGEGTAESVDDCLGVLKTEIHRLNGVLESFRNFANLQRLQVRPSDPLELLEEVIQLIQPQARQQQIQIQFLHPETALPPVPLDAEKFTQAILNLIINALEAMPTGGHLSISATVREGSLVVEVSDTGPGVPPEVQANMFKPYFSTKSKGSGMGLALTEKLVNQHGGHISYHTGGQGTTFCVTIPMVAGGLQMADYAGKEEQDHAQ